MKKLKSLVPILLFLALVSLGAPFVEASSQHQTIPDSIFLPAIYGGAAATPDATVTATPTATPTPTPTATTPAVSVLRNHSSYMTSAFVLHIVGEVRNTTNSHVEFVKITANIFDSSNNLLATDFSFARLDSIAPGETSCFDISLSLARPDRWARYEIASPTYSSGADPLPNLTVFNDSDSYDDIYGWYTIIGQVRNDHGARVKFVSPIATVYDFSGAVRGCDFAFVSSRHLDPGQTSSFEMIMTGRHYSGLLFYRLQVEGRE